MNPKSAQFPLARLYLIALFSGMGLLLALSAQHAVAADKSCEPVVKAGKAALAMKRIHQAGYMPPEKGARPAPTANALSHSVAVDQTYYFSLGNSVFDQKPIKNDTDRTLAYFYAEVIAGLDDNCRSLGKATLAGRSAFVFEQGSNKSPDDMLVKVWIDSATGLPLRADLDEAQVDTNWVKGKKGTPAAETKRNDKRQVNSVAFIYGDAVKAPVLSGKKTLLGTPANLDAQAMSQLLSLLN